MSPRPKSLRHGATLIELFVAIGVIGLIFSIAFPAFINAKAAGGRTKSLANARSAALAITQYCSSHDDLYPALISNTPYPVGPDAEMGIIINDDVEARWATRHRWWAVIADPVTMAEHWGSWFSPGVDPSSGAPPSYYFSNSFVAAPQLWTSHFNGSRDVLRNVRTSEVEHPANKAMVWDGVLAYQHPSIQPHEGALHWLVPIAFADLHAEVRRFVDATAPVPNVLNHEAWANSPLHNTPSGASGRDY